MLCHQREGRIQGNSELRVAFAFHDGGADHAGDMGMHCIRRLKGERHPACAPKEQQQRLQHLIGAVGDKDLV